MRLELGPVTLDTERRQLLRGSESLHVSAKAYQLLVHLVETRPRALSKEEIAEALWPDSYVSETSLTTLVNELRSLLGESARTARWIRTVHGFGYAFADLDGDAPAPCRLFWGPREVPLYPGDNVLGREPGTRGSIPDASVSRRHARVVVRGDEATIEDLGSKNGTYLEERRLEGPAVLADGDAVRLGLVTLVFRAGGGGATSTRSVELGGPPPPPPTVPPPRKK